MLLVRTILILFFTLNVLGNQRINLLFIVTVCIIILGLMWNIGTVYKHWWVNVIESFYIVNLALLAGWCEYNHQTSTSYARDQSIIAYILVGSALLVFIVIAVVRVVIRVKSVISKQRHAHPLETCQLTAVPAEDEPVLPTRPVLPTVSYIEFKHSESEFES